MIYIIFAQINIDKLIKPHVIPNFVCHLKPDTNPLICNMINSDEIFNLIRNTVKSVSPKAEIYLFGSRARGTNRQNSDWDVLVLIDAPTLSPLHKDLDYQIWSRGLEYGQEINTVIRTKDQWESNPSLFKYNVTQDRIKL